MRGAGSSGTNPTLSVGRQSPPVRMGPARFERASTSTHADLLFGVAAVPAAVVRPAKVAVCSTGSSAASNLEWPQKRRATVSLETTDSRTGAVQRELECGAARRVRDRPQATVVRLDNRAADRETHPHPVGLGSEERVEDPLDIFRADSRAGIERQSAA